MSNNGYEKILMCKYQVLNFILMCGEERIETDPSNILSIEYVNDYEFNLRAILKVNIRVDVRRKIWILKNKRNLSVKFELCKIGQDVEGEAYNTGSETVWNKEFVAYFNDEEEATDTAMLEERVGMNEGTAFASNDIDTENYFESQNMMDLFLFDQKFLNASKTTYNTVFTKNTLQSCVARLLTETKHDRVLMSRFENDEIYEELLVPANPSYKNLIYLDQYYGFYKTGAMIYYDVDTLYILNTNGKITAKQPDEWAETCFMVSAMDLATPGNGMIRREGEKRYYVSINEMDINPQNFSIQNNVNEGSEAKIVITDDIAIDIGAANQSYIDQRNERIAYTKKDDNKFTANITKARMEENECSLFITGNNFDIKAFTPNKEYQVIFNETSKQQRYGQDKYRLAYAYHYIMLESDSYMTASHRVILKKRASDEVVETTRSKSTPV